MRTVNKQDLEDYRTLLKQELGIEVVEKTTSRFMKLLAKVLFFNKNFMSGYITTIGNRVYWPNMEKGFGDNPESDFAVLFHEGQHGSDSQSVPFLYEIAYLIPQILAVFGLLALLSILLNSHWLVFVFALFLATPIPSPGRMHIEMRALSCNIAFWVWCRGGVSQQSLDRFTRMFTTADYYFMWPSKSYCMKRFARAEEKVRAGELTRWQRLTYSFLESRGVIEKASS